MIAVNRSDGSQGTPESAERTAEANAAPADSVVARAAAIVEALEEARAARSKPEPPPIPDDVPRFVVFGRVQ